jgi:hypothetical protein
MKNDKLTDFNILRKTEHQKSPANENFLSAFNNALDHFEHKQYKEYPEQHPTVFVTGSPRSGTTLMSQVIAHAFNIGFINNLSARFFKNPVSGIHFAQAVFGNRHQSDFSSVFASTKELSDIHEFGYFWRYWLKKESISDTLRAKEIEPEIQWDDLKLTILNMHQAFGMGWACKNVLGAYHIEKFLSLLDKSVFVYIERNPVDSAISIYNARMKYYGDPSIWWSYIPLEYNTIKDWDPIRQIAGQVFYLNQWYKHEIQRLNSPRILSVKYEDLCKNPHNIIQQIKETCREECNYALETKDGIPRAFPLKSYPLENQLASEFLHHFNQFNGK